MKAVLTQHTTKAEFATAEEVVGQSINQPRQDSARSLGGIALLYSTCSGSRRSERVTEHVWWWHVWLYPQPSHTTPSNTTAHVFFLRRWLLHCTRTLKTPIGLRSNIKISNPLPWRQQIQCTYVNRDIGNHGTFKTTIAYP